MQGLRPQTRNNFPASCLTSSPSSGASPLWAIIMFIIIVMGSAAAAPAGGPRIKLARKLDLATHSSFHSFSKSAFQWLLACSCQGRR